MSEMKLMTLAAQQHYDEKIKGFIAEEDAKLLDKIETHVHSWNDLEDKPFGEVETKTVIVEEQTIPAGKEGGGYETDFTNNFHKYLGDINGLHSSELTKPITVVFDGNTYEYDGISEAFSEGVMFFYVGNGSLAVYSADVTDEPFAFAFVNSEKRLYVSDMSIEHSIEVYRLESDIKIIDEKFIPDTIARISDIENIDLTPYETKTNAVAKLEEAKDFASEEDAKVQAAVDTLSGKVTTLVGDDANKSVRTIANEELAKQLVAEGAKESLDTLTEIAAWIQSHPDDASAMNKAISDLEALVGALPDGVAATTVIGYVQEVVAANKALIDANTEAIGALHTVATTGSWNDLEDKPFYEERQNAEVTVLRRVRPEWSNEYTPNENIYRAIEFTENAETDYIIIGSDIIVYSEAGKYILPYRGCYSYEGSSELLPYWGNLSLLVSSEVDTGEPFFISVSPNFYEPVNGEEKHIDMIYTSDTAIAEHNLAITVAVVKDIDVIQTLDSKFIGSDIARVADFSEVANEEIDAMFA